MLIVCDVVLYSRKSFHLFSLSLSLARYADHCYTSLFNKQYIHWSVSAILGTADDDDDEREREKKIVATEFTVISRLLSRLD